MPQFTGTPVEQNTPSPAFTGTPVSNTPKFSGTPVSLKPTPEMRATEPTVGDFMSDVWAEFKSGGSLTENAMTLMFRTKQYTPEYDSEGQLVDVRKETDSEYDTRVRQSREIRRNRIGAPDKDSAAGITGSVLRELTDPAALAFGGVGLNTLKEVPRLIKLMSAGAAYEGSAASLEQLVDSGEITDTKEISNRAILGGIAFPVIDKAFRVGSNIVKKRGVKKASRTVDDVERKVLEWKDKGLNPSAAWERALEDLHLNDPVVQTAVDKAGRKVSLNKKLEDLPIPTKTLSKILSTRFKESFVGEHASSVATSLDKYIGVLSTRIKKISKPLFYSLRKFEVQTKVRTHELLEETKSFRAAYRKLSSADKKRFKIAALNADESGVRSLLGPTSAGTVDTVRNVLNNLYKETQEAGHDIGFIEGYFPRLVKDVKKLRAKLGNEDRGRLDRELSDAKKRKGSSLNQLEESDVINKAIRSKFQGRGIGRSNFMKARQIEEVPEELAPFYADPDEALLTYIQHTVHNLEKRKFFGHGASKNPKYNENIVDSVGDVLRRDLQAGNITAADVDDLKPLLESRFGQGEKASSKIIQDTKNVFYAATLANPISAATQLGDLGIAAFINGISNTLKAAFLPRSVRLEDFGINLVAEEMSSTKKTAKMLNFLLGVSLFKSVDKLGKTSLINGSLRKFTALSKTVKGRSALRKRFRDAFTPEELGAAVQRLNTGGVDSQTLKEFPAIRDMIWNDLLDAQPVALSELPQAYLDSPNLRILYMLKTFTIKHLDIMRRSFIDDIKSGNPKKVRQGFTNMLRMSGLFIAANMTADEVKEIMLGREVRLEDKIIANIYRNFSTSEYVLDQFAEGKTFEAVAGVLLTPVSVGTTIYDDVMDDLRSQGEQFKSLRHVPVGGKLMYNWIGGGKESFEKYQETEGKR